MSNEITQFKYEHLDESMADFLRQKESNMREIIGKAYTELGKELYEAQQRLARQGSKYHGVFERWYTSLGFKKTSVYNYINRYNLVQQLNEVDEVVDVEELPNNLTYEIAKPSAESTPAKAQAKSEVLAGDIASLKEYSERIKELERKAEQAEQSAEIERKERKRLEKENAELAAQMSKEEAYDEPETESIESRTPYGAKLGQAMYGALRELSEWQKEYSWIITDANEFRKMYEADANFAREFTRVREFWKQLEMAVGRNEGSTVVDADFSVIN